MSPKKGSADVMTGLTKEDLDEMIGRAVKAAVDTLSTDLNRYYERKFEKFGERQDALQSENLELKQKLGNLEEKIDILLKKLNEQKLETENQKIQVKKALTQTNNNEQYSRRDNIKIYGLSLLPGDDCKSKVKNFLAKDLNIHVKDEEISVAHIVPRRIQPTNPGQAPQPPPLLLDLHQVEGTDVWIY